MIHLEPQTITERPVDSGKRPPAVAVPLEENFAALAQRLSTLRSGETHKTVGVCSRYPQEGVSTVAVNLAAGLAELARGKVLLIEASGPARRPAMLGQPGWSDLLLGDAEIPEALQPTAVPKLDRIEWGRHLLTGPLLCDPRRLALLMEALKERFEFLLVDLPHADAATACYPIASVLDGIVLVVQAGRVGVNEAIRVKQELQQSGAHLVGVVLNKRRSYVPRWLRWGMGGVRSRA